MTPEGRGRPGKGKRFGVFAALSCAGTPHSNAAFGAGRKQVDLEVGRLAVHSSEEPGYTNGQGKEIPRFLEESPVPF